MARPVQVSDEAILQAAERIFAQKGLQGFSLAAVAREVGITRAAITFRFENSRALKIRTVERGITRFADEMAALEIERGGDGLMAIAGYIAGRIKSRANLANFMLHSQARTLDNDLEQLERQRGEIMRGAIDRAMPLEMPNRTNAMKVFAAHLTGTLIAWTASDDAEARTFTMGRTAMLLDIMGITHSFDDAGQDLAQTTAAG